MSPPDRPVEDSLQVFPLSRLWMKAPRNPLSVIPAYRVAGSDESIATAPPAPVKPVSIRPHRCPPSVVANKPDWIPKPVTAKSREEFSWSIASPVMYKSVIPALIAVHV
jgi:hypothetical protein